MDRDVWRSNKTQLLYWAVFFAVAFSMTSFVISVIRLAERESNAFEASNTYNTLGSKKLMRHVILDTSIGKIEISLDRLNAPTTVNNFVSFVQEGYYDNTRFHKVIPGEVIGGGDPLSRESNKSLWGTGGPGFVFEDELQDEPNRYGDIVMDNHGYANTNGSQFLIILASTTSAYRGYTLFGHVVKGMDVVEKISSVPLDGEGHPLASPTLKSAFMKP